MNSSLAKETPFYEENPFTIYLTQHIESQNAAAWDELIPHDHPTLKSAFLNFLEGKVGNHYNPFYLTLYQKERLVAVVIFFTMKVQYKNMVLYLWGGLGKILKFFLPSLFSTTVLFCGSPIPIVTRGFWSIEEEEIKKTIFPVILRAVDKLKRHLHLKIVCFKELTEQESRETTSAFRNEGYLRVPHLAQMILKNQWSSEEEYLRGLKHRERNRIQNILKTRDREGIRVTSEDRFPKDQIAPLHSLYCRVWRRVTYKLEFVSPDFFGELHTALSPMLKVYCLWKGNELVGFSSALLTPHWVKGLYLGDDHRKNRKLKVLLNGMYEMIRLGIKEQREIDLGQTTYEMKKKFGAKPNPLFLFVQFHGMYKPIGWATRLIRGHNT